MKSTMEEVLLAFSNPNCIISSVELYLGNQQVNPNKISGIDHYVRFMKERENNIPKNIVGIGVPSLMTLQSKDLYIFNNIYFLDGNIRSKVSNLGKQWYITTKNLTYCLTCDIFHPGNEYYEWKMSVAHMIWRITEETNYTILI